MTAERSQRRYARLIDLLSLLATVASCLVLSVWTFRTGVRTFFRESVPLGGDGLATAQYIRMFNESPSANLFSPVRSGWIGWPDGFQSQYFPSGIWLELSFIRLYSMITGVTEPSMLLKTFALLRTLPIALGTWVFGRVIGLNQIGRFVLSLCFTLSTFNVIRAVGHFGLGMTWTVPAIATVLMTGMRLASSSETKSLNHPRLQVMIMTVVMFVCGLSGFYYTVFGMILGSVAVVMTLAPKAAGLRTRESGFWSNTCNGLTNLIVPISALLIGFLVQVVPAIVAQRASPPLSATADRGWTESIVYSGSPESLFYDFHALVLRVSSQPAILNFLESRATWEARQIGAIAGFAAYLFLLGFLLRVVGIYRQRQSNEIAHGQRFDHIPRIRSMLIICLALYLAGPFSFGLSRTIFPFIRAWGRIAPFITLFLVALLLFEIQRIRSALPQLILYVLIVMTLLFEMNSYRKTFPEGRALAVAADEANAIRHSTINDLSSLFASDCRIAQLPIYPFPEYDSPNDTNGDYGLLELPLADNSRYRWSYGAIKNTDASRHYAPFVSQQPPFARISLSQQIQYWAALRPCGAVIDRTYLYEEEQLELDEILSTSRPECVKPLEGERFNDESRYVAINFSVTACQLRIGALTQQLVTMANNKEILWQPMTVGIERFERYWAMMPEELPHQLMYSVRGNRKMLDVRISVLVLAGTGPFANQPLELCVSAAETSCHSLFTNSAGLVELPTTLYASDELHSMLSVSIAANSDTPLEWGAILLPSNPNSAN